MRSGIIAAEAVCDLNIRYMRNGISMLADLKGMGWSTVNIKYQRFLYSGLQDCAPFLPGSSCCT